MLEMPKNAAIKGGASEIPQGTHNATLYAIFAIGSQKNERGWKPQKEIQFSFEFPELEWFEYKQGEGKKPPAAHTKKFGGKAANEFYYELTDGEDSGENGWKIAAVIGCVFKLRTSEKKSGKRIYVNIDKIKDATGEIAENRANALAYFNIDENPATGGEYTTAAEMMECPYYNSMPEFLRERVKTSIEFSRLPDALKFPPKTEDEKAK